MLKSSSPYTCVTKINFEHHFFGEKKARVFLLLHFLTIVQSTWGWGVNENSTAPSTAIIRKGTNVLVGLPSPASSHLYRRSYS